MIQRTHYEARVIFSSAPRPQDELLITHEEVFKGDTAQEALEKMQEYTGDMPKKPRKVYRDNENGEAVAVGYVWAEWVHAYDRSRPNRKVWEEKWCEVARVVTFYGLPDDVKQQFG